MKYEDIKDFNQRCEEHPDHQTGMISERMIQDRLSEEIDELRAYIETKQEQGEPVACPYCKNNATLGAVYYDQNCVGCVKRMTRPQQRTWVGLTDEEIQAEWLLTPQHDKAEGLWFGRRLEAKLKEKNT